MNEIIVRRADIEKVIYFIAGKAQKQNGHAMQGALSSKGDLMGGIFDRWINIISESIIFNKCILPPISNGKKIDVIPDFYLYDPKIAGIAPDIFGIKIDGRSIPFVEFNEIWSAVAHRPQIEVKTFKQPQKMISLRNQNYDEKYLVMVESILRIDYLLPFMDASLFSESAYNQLNMDDSVFIHSNQNQRIKKIDRIDCTSDIIGTLKLLSITRSDAFMHSATHCEGSVSVQYISSIEESKRNSRTGTECRPLLDFCNITDCGLYRFNEKWYDGINSDNIPFKLKGKTRTRQFLLRTLDFSTDKIEALTVTKSGAGILYIDVDEDCSLNAMQLKKGSRYKISFAELDRSGNEKDEYFMQKDLIQFVPDKKDELEKILEEIIKNN